MSGQDIERGQRANKNRTGSSSSNNNGAHVPSPTYLIEDTETQWTSWLVPMFVVANVAVFIVVLYINDCPKHDQAFKGKCVARFLGRFSFEPLRKNPLLGPSSHT